MADCEIIELAAKLNEERGFGHAALTTDSGAKGFYFLYKFWVIISFQRLFALATRVKPAAIFTMEPRPLRRFPRPLDITTPGSRSTTARLPPSEAILLPLPPQRASLQVDGLTSPTSQRKNVFPSMI